MSETTILGALDAEEAAAEAGTGEADAVFADAPPLAFALSSCIL
jgi:hypothetical protein